MKHIVSRRYWWFALSALLILPGLYFLLLHPLVTTGQARLGLRPSIDFTGGAIWELHFPDQEPSADEVAQIFAEQGFDGALVQLSRASTTAGEVAAAIVRTKALSSENPEAEQQQVLDALTARYGTVERARLDTVGAVLSAESTRNAIVADPDFRLTREEVEPWLDPVAFTGRSAAQVDEFLEEVAAPALANLEAAEVAAPRV